MCKGLPSAGGRVSVRRFRQSARGDYNVNDLHYREIAIVGSESIGTPPNQCRNRLDQALDLLRDPNLPFQSLITSRCGFADVEAAIVRRQSFAGLKSMFIPESH